MARRRGRQFAVKARRATDWQKAIGIPAALGSCPSDSTLVFGTVSTVEGSLPLGTLIRIRGTIHVELAAETGATTLQAFGIGIGLFDDAALAVSTGAGSGLPGPLDDPDSEKWMWIKYGFLGDGPSITQSPESDGTGRRIAMEIDVDSKAMRKWDENQTLVWKIQNDPVDGVATEIDVVGMGRMLLKLN